MKKLFLTLAVAVASASVVSAQGPRDNFGNAQLGTYDRVTKHGPYLTGKFWDNTFIGVAGGVNLYQYNFKGMAKPKITKRLAPAVEVNLGKWITPTTGVRIGYTGMQLKTYNTLQKSNASHKLKFMHIHGDLLFNLSNAVAGYRADRRWDLVPYIGAGYARAWNKGKSVNSHQLAASAGLLNNFRIAPRVNFTLEGRWMITNRRFDGILNRSPKADEIFTVTAGLGFKFGRKAGFKRPVYQAPVDISGYESRIKSLEGNVARDRSTIDRLTRELEAARNRPAQVVEKSAPVHQATYFKIGRSEVSATEKANLKKIADVIKASTGRKFNVTGYADKGTGTSAINMTLSEKRANNVADVLVKTYGVNRSQLVVSGKGGVDRNPGTPVLDRVVITE